MKKVLAYILLFSYTTMLFKPVLPSISDFIAHTFWYSRHMATVHYEHGKYHVHYQYLEESKKNFPIKNAHLLKNEMPSNDYFVCEQAYDFLFWQTPHDHFKRLSFYLSSASLKDDYPPPRA